MAKIILDFRHEYNEYTNLWGGGEVCLEIHIFQREVIGFSGHHTVQNTYE